MTEKEREFVYAIINAIGEISKTEALNALDREFPPVLVRETGTAQHARPVYTCGHEAPASTILMKLCPVCLAHNRPVQFIGDLPRTARGDPGAAQPESNAMKYWTKVAALFHTGGMDDPAFLFGMVEAQTQEYHRLRAARGETGAAPPAEEEPT